MFLQHWCPENKAKQRFPNQNVRQFYVFATLMSGKQCKTTISRPKCATVLCFCNTDVRKTKQNNDFTISEQKKTKKNAARDAPGKQNTISRRFVRNPNLKPRKCDRGLQFHVFKKKTKTIQVSKPTSSTERGRKKWPLRKKSERPLDDLRTTSGSPESVIGVFKNASWSARNVIIT